MSDSNNQFPDHTIDSLHHIMYDSPGFFFIKDLKGCYIYMNKHALEVAGSTNMSEILGKNDHNHEFPWQKYGHIYQNNDSTVHTNKETMNILEISETHTGRTFVMLSHKQPFYSKGKEIGVCGTSLEVPSPPALSQTALNETSIFFDSKKGVIINLSSKRRLVAYHFLQGLSTKEISGKLSLSIRTVEHYIDAIKDISEYSSARELLLYLRII